MTSTNPNSSLSDAEAVSSSAVSSPIAPSPIVAPLTLGSIVAPSSVIFGSHETNLGTKRAFSPRHVAYYERRAAGGAGVIVTEDASVHVSDWPYERAPLAADCAEGWVSIAAAVRPQGALVIAGLSHSGGQGTSHWSQRELWAPSPVPEVNTREVPKVMEDADIEAVIAGFASAATIAVTAGCDGVEVNAGQFSLVRQFLSGLTNQRSDGWADRARFVSDVLSRVRAAIGGSAVLGLRLSCDELAPWAGITPEAAAELVPSLCELVDYVTVVRGSIYSVGATRPDGHTPAGFNADLVRSIRAAVRAEHGDRVRVIGQGSIVDVDQAAWMLNDGVCDAVEMTRAQIADADLVAKVRSGAAERVRPCLLCNQNCQVRDNRNPIVSCVMDPRSGHETSEPDESVVRSIPSTVVVIGGGPAGLEAARVAALRGHTVELRERTSQLGGNIRVAANGAGRERLALAAEWLEREVRQLGVTVSLNCEEQPVSAASAATIVAVGSRSGRPDWQRDPEAVVITAAEALADLSAVPSGPGPDGVVLIWDPIGGPIGVSVAESLVAMGRSVHLMTQDQIVGNELARSGDLGPANARLQSAGVVLHRRRVLRSVTATTAEIENRFTGERETIEIVALIDAGPRLPADPGGGVHGGGAVSVGAVQAGDCVAPRTLYEAILEGRRAAMAI